MSVQSSHQSLTERKPRKQLTPHTIFIAHQIQLGKIMLNSWQYFKKLATESRGSELIDLPGYGSIYLKLPVQNTFSTGKVAGPKTTQNHPRFGKMLCSILNFFFQPNSLMNQERFTMLLICWVTWVVSSSYSYQLSVYLFSHLVKSAINLKL